MSLRDRMLQLVDERAAPGPHEGARGDPQLNIRVTPSPVLEDGIVDGATASRTLGGAAQKGYCGMQLLVLKRSADNVCAELFGVSAHVVYDDEASFGTSMRCTSKCSYKKECLHVIGGTRGAISARRDLWVLPPAHSGAARRSTICGTPAEEEPLAGANAKVPRGFTKARSTKLREMVRAALRDNVGRGCKRTFVFTLHGPDGLYHEVCAPLWHAVTGYSCQSRAFRSAVRDLELVGRGMAETCAAAAVHVDAGEELPESTMSTCLVGGRGVKGLKAAQYVATQVALFADSIPHLREIRLSFASWKSLHGHMSADFKIFSVSPEIVGYKHFTKVTVHADIVKDAVALKAGFRTHAHMVASSPKTWSLKLTNPRTKNTFAKCATCARIEALKRSGYSQKDYSLFKFGQDSGYLHFKLVQGRRRKHNSAMAEAAENPREVLAICVDGIDKAKIDSPFLGRALRRSKELKDMPRFKTALIGAIAHGHTEKRALYMVDSLIGNSQATTGEKYVGAGMNETATIVTHMLSQVQLPTSRRRRVLYLQFDNCGDNKNWLMLVLSALLVRSGTFTEVHVDFLHVGHTHILIDQWFSSISTFLTFSDQDLSTIDKLAAAFRTEYGCGVFRCDVVLDFAKEFRPFAASVSGHSAPFTFMFKTDEFGKVVCKTQTSERVDGPWHSFKPLKEVDIDSFAFELQSMPLKSFADAVSGYKAESGDNDVARLLKKLESMNEGAPHDVFPADSLVWWRQYLHDLEDDDFVQNRMSNPVFPSTTVDFTPRHLESEAGASKFDTMVVTFEACVAAGLFRSDSGPQHLQSEGIRGEEAVVNHQKAQWAYNLQVHAEKSQRGLLTLRDLPRRGDMFVYTWREDSCDMRESDDSEEETDTDFMPPHQFAIGVANAVPVVDSPGDSNAGKGEEWSVPFKGLMPREWVNGTNKIIASQPNVFAEAPFTEEWESVHVTENMMMGTRAGRSQAADVVRRYQGDEVDMDDDTGLQKTTKKRRTAARAVRRQRTGACPGDCLVLTQKQTPLGGKWELLQSGKISNKNVKYLRQYVGFACSHFACLEHPQHCPDAMCQPVRDAIRESIKQ